jgi:D-alanyl-D-alanine carboxypeptidase/D-alanyl-D-alanine-endopeptidase (penicillin-binding protein 4)
MPALTFRNCLTALPVATDSCYITGFPFSTERYLYGVVPAQRSRIKIRGDIPDPSLYLAQYFHAYLVRQGLPVRQAPSCHRILAQEGQWRPAERRKLVTTRSLPLKELIRITHFASQNLYADVLLKTIGQRSTFPHPEALSSFEKGARAVKSYWEKQGLDTSPLWMYDGSGLSAADRVTARFLCDLYVFMATHPDVADTFVRSLPQAGVEGTVRGMFKESALRGKARLKSGTMSRVRCYGGYITKDGKRYAVALLVNNFSGKSSRARAEIEELLLALFRTSGP